MSCFVITYSWLEGQARCQIWFIIRQVVQVAMGYYMFASLILYMNLMLVTFGNPFGPTFPSLIIGGHVPLQPTSCSLLSSPTYSYLPGSAGVHDPDLGDLQSPQSCLWAKRFPGLNQRCWAWLESWKEKKITIGDLCHLNCKQIIFMKFVWWKAIDWYDCTQKPKICT